MSFADQLTALDEILHLAAERHMDLSDVRRFSAFVREQLIIRQEVAHRAEQRRQQDHQVRTRLAWRQWRERQRDGLIPLDPLDVADCPQAVCDRHAPYSSDLRAEAEWTAREIRG